LSSAKDLDWPALIGFIQRTQNLPETNQRPWVSTDPDDRGGFVYYPGYSMAGERDPAKKTLRSYGSMSYAGLLSCIYAELKKDDARVANVLDWLKRHWTLDENPGLGAQGLYYYYHMMAKALSTAGLDTLELADGRKIDWRRDLSLKLLDLQKADGSWINDTGRWMEKDPVLVTSYATIALEILFQGM
jgi:squalene-hopene/tetraprenyl-beta-curcumene cyclase